MTGTKTTKRLTWCISALAAFMSTLAYGQASLKVVSTAVSDPNNASLSVQLEGTISDLSALVFDLQYDAAKMSRTGAPARGPAISVQNFYWRDVAPGRMRFVVGPDKGLTPLAAGTLLTVPVSLPATASPVVSVTNYSSGAAVTWTFPLSASDGLLIHPQLADADTDGDGIADATELAMGKDPVNPYDRLYSNALASFTLDGALTEWGNVTPFVGDASDASTGIDWRGVRVANDAVNLYLAFENDQAYTSFTGLMMYLDTNGSGSGFGGATGNFPIKADYVIMGWNQQLQLSRYKGDGTTWDWEYLGTINQAQAGSVVETYIRRDRIGGAGEVKLFFQEESGADFYPDKTLLAGHYFSYQADASLSPPTIQTAANPVAGIDFDGALTEWSTLTGYATDPDDVSGTGDQVDWRGAWMAHDAVNFYLAVENDHIQTSNTGFTVFLETDGARTTGYRGAGDQFPIGAQYMISGWEGSYSLFAYSGTGNDWQWTFIGPVSTKSSGARRELFFRQDAVGSPASVGLLFYGDNTAYGTFVEDYYPNSSQIGLEYFAYNAEGPPPGGTRPVYSNPTAGLAVDGSDLDWQIVQAFPQDPADISLTPSEVDWRQAWMAHDETRLYFAVENDRAFAQTSGVTLYLDTDANRSTGFRGGANDSPVGADYMISGWGQTFNVYRYTGAGTDWVWEFNGAPQSSINGSFVEISVLLSTVGAPEYIHVYLYGDNTPYNSTDLDYYPNYAALGSDYFTYRVAGQVVDIRPQAKPAAAGVSYDDLQVVLASPGSSIAFSSAGSTDPSGGTLTYLWDFGDGTQSTAANPSHVFSAPGNYTVTLSVDNGTYSSMPTSIVVTVTDGVGATRGRLPVNSSTKFVIYYGNDFGTTNLNKLKQFDVVVIDPNQPNCTPQIVADLQAAGATVLGYISIGEESKTPSTAALVGDGRGPVYMDEATKQLVYENRGIASFYVDSMYTSGAYLHDGEADANGEWGGWYVMPDSTWRWVINVQRIGGNPGVFTERTDKAGLSQIAGTRSGDLSSRRGDFGFNGFFLDTIDTSGPYAGVGYYPWTAPAMRDTVKFISDAYPDHVVLGNRGTFFYQAGTHNPTYDIRPIDYTIRPYVDAALFESYMLDSNASDDLASGESAFFADNKNNVAPKMMAEANRSDGFAIFGIDYMMNRGATLYDQAMQETVVANGWSQYLSETREIDVVTTYVADRLPITDTSAPVWTTTGAGYNQQLPARVGVQEVVPGTNAGEIIVRWDVARDQTVPVRYNVYLSTDPNFGTSTKYANVAFSTGEGWAADPFSRFANQYKITGLANGTYYVRVRAEDSTPTHYEDSNTATLSISIGAPPTVTYPVTGLVINGYVGDWSSVTPMASDGNDVALSGNQWDYAKAWLAHDTYNFYIAVENETSTPLNYGHHVFMDTDDNQATGYVGTAGNFSVGAEYMIEGNRLYKYAGARTDWSWNDLGPLVSVTVGKNTEYAISRALLSQPAYLRLFLMGDNAVFGSGIVDYYPNGAATGTQYFRYQFDAGVAEKSNYLTNLVVNGSVTDWPSGTNYPYDPADITGTTNQVDWRRTWIGHNNTNLYIAIESDTTVTLNWGYRVFLDTDSNRAFGYRGSSDNFSIGAEYMLENNILYQYAGTGTDWTWTTVGTVTKAQSGKFAEFSFARSLIGSPANFNVFFYGDNAAFGGTTVDVAPNNALKNIGPYFRYRFQTAE